MTRAGIYIRKSRQDKGQEAFRLELQRKKLPAHARAHGWIPEIYDDGVISGSTVETRREMVRLITDIEAGRINVVLCIELSRLSRDDSMADSLNFLNMCAAKGVKLATPERLLDPSDTASWFLAIMEGGFSAVEMKTLKKRIREGRQVARSKGRWLGGVVPYGYTYDKARKVLVPNPDTAKIVRAVFHERVVKKTSVDAIVRRARLRGWPSPRGGQWVSSTILRILRNPLYGGFVRFEDKLVKSAAEPLVDQPTWNAAQSFRVRPPGRRKPTLLLTGRGRVRCGYCGHPVNCAMSRDRRINGEWGKTFRYYHCYGRHLGTPCKTLRNVPDWELEGVVLGVLYGVFQHKAELLDGIGKHLAELQGELPEQRRRLEGKLKAALASEDKLLRAYEAGAISLEQLKARNESHRQQTDAIQKDIMALDLQLARQGGDFDRAALEKRLDGLAEELGNASFEKLRTLLDPLVSKVRLFNEKAEVTFSFPLDGETKHCFPLPGRSLLNGKPPGKMSARDVKVPVGAKELSRMTLGGILASPCYKQAFVRASLS